MDELKLVLEIQGHPQAPETMEADPPATTIRRLDLLHLPNFHEVQSCLSIHQTKAQQTHLHFEPTSRWQTPHVHELHARSTTSTSSLMTPGRSAIEAGAELAVGLGGLQHKQWSPPPFLRRRNEEEGEEEERTREEEETQPSLIYF